MNGLSETNSTPIFLFFESVLKLMKKNSTLEFRNFRAAGAGTKRGNSPGIPREFPNFPENWGIPRLNRVPGERGICNKADVRFLTDFREVNKCIQRKPFLLPRIGESL